MIIDLLSLPTYPQIYEKNRNCSTYNDENLMFASLASNRRQTAFRLRADLLDRLDAVFDEPNDETLAAMKEADNLTKIDMSNYESFLKSLE